MTDRRQKFFPYLESQKGNRFSVTYSEDKGRKTVGQEIMGRLLDSSPVFDDGGKVCGVRLKFRPGYFLDEGRKTKDHKKIPPRAQMDWHEEGEIEEHEFGPFVEVSQQTHTVFEGQKDTKPEDLRPEDVIHDSLSDIWVLMGDRSQPNYRELRFVILI